MNEGNLIAKYIFSTIAGDTYCNDNFLQKNSFVFEEVVPVKVDTTVPQIMFMMKDSQDVKGAFGIRLFSVETYQIKAVVEGADFSLIADMADQIDRLFDWTNQIDAQTQQPKNQQLYVDPDDNTRSIRIMSFLRMSKIKYTTFSNGVNYCHFGGEYKVEYYVG